MPERRKVRLAADRLHSTQVYLASSLREPTRLDTAGVSFCHITVKRRPGLATGMHQPRHNTSLDDKTAFSNPPDFAVVRHDKCQSTLEETTVAFEVLSGIVRPLRQPVDSKEHSCTHTTISVHSQHSLVRLDRQRQRKQPPPLATTTPISPNSREEKARKACRCLNPSITTPCKGVLTADLRKIFASFIRRLRANECPGSCFPIGRVPSIPLREATKVEAYELHRSCIGNERQTRRQQNPRRSS